MKVFLPFCEEAMAEPSALSGADLMPYRLEYQVLRVARVRVGASPPEPGEAQILEPETSVQALAS